MAQECQNEAEKEADSPEVREMIGLLWGELEGADRFWIMDPMPGSTYPTRIAIRIDHAMLRIDAIQTVSGISLSFAPHSVFERVRAKEAVKIVHGDVASPPSVKSGSYDPDEVIANGCPVRVQYVAVGPCVMDRGTPRTLVRPFLIRCPVWLLGEKVGDPWNLLIDFPEVLSYTPRLISTLDTRTRDT